MLVGASVLMAAVSNAGKLRSNQEEQQKYLTLSSALTLLCGELESVEYCGTYSYQREAVFTSVTGEDGAPEEKFDHYKHICAQTTGELRVESASPWTLNEVLPLYSDLDRMFADRFEVPAGQRNPVDDYIYITLSAAQPQNPYVVTLAANGDEDTYGGLTEKVRITAEMNARCEITLTATFEADGSYIMEAVLKPDAEPENLLFLNVHSQDGNYETEPMKWTQEYIIKKEKGEAGG